jgi:hypothetical protein
MVTITSGTTPREELDLAIVEGEGALQGLIGAQVLGPLGINYRNAHMVKATLGNSLGLRHIASNKYVRAQGAKFERLSATLGDATLTVTTRGVEITVPREMTLDYRNKFDVLSFFSNRFGVEISGLTKEKLIADTVFAAAAFYRGSAINGSVEYTTANRDTAGTSGMNPIQDIINSARYIRALGEVPDSVAMSGPVWERVRTCQNTLQFCRGTFGAIMEVTKEIFQRALAEFGIKQVLVGDNYYNNAADGATPSLSQVWSNAYIAVFRAGNTGASSTGGVGVPVLSGIGANVFWQGFDTAGQPSSAADALQFNGGNYVETYESKETKSDIIRIEMSHKPTITNTRAGDLIATRFA